MAIALDHVSAEISGAATGAAEGLSFTTTGNLNIVILSRVGALNSVTSVADNASNTYAQATSSAEFGDDLEIWYSANATTGANTVTINFTGGGVVSIRFFDCSGAATSPLGPVNSLTNQGPISNPVGPSVTATMTGGFCVSAVDPGSGSLTAIASPFVFQTGGGWFHGYDLDSVGGTLSPSWTSSASTVWQGITALFYPPAGAAVFEDDTFSVNRTQLLDPTITVWQ